MIISSILAAVLSLTSTNDYFFTVITSSNVAASIRGEGMGESCAGLIPRMEDIAFLHEATLERYATAKSYSLTNINLYLVEFPVTNRASLAMTSAGSTRPGFAVPSIMDMQKAFAVGPYEQAGYSGRMTTNELFGILYSEKNLKPIVDRPKKIREYRYPDDTQFYPSELVPPDYDQGLGFRSAGYGWTNSTPHTIFTATNFACFYHNLKAASIVQNVKGARYLHSFGSVRKVIENGFNESYSSIEDQYSIHPFEYDHSNTNRVEESSALSRVAANIEGSGYVTFSKNPWIGDGRPLRYYSYSYIEDEITTESESAYFHVAIATGQTYTVRSCTAFARFRLSLSNSTNIIDDLWAVPCEVLKQNEDGKVEIRIALADLMDELCVTYDFSRASESESMLAGIAGGFPDDIGTRDASLSYAIYILDVASEIEMKWRTRVKE